MTVRHILAAFGAAAFFALLPLGAQAYFTTDQQTVRLDERTVLHTITYEFGSGKYDVMLPIMASDTVTEERAEVEYTLMAGEDMVAADTVAIVLSDAEVRDNQYFVPAEESAVFTLVVLQTLPAVMVSTGADLSVQVTDLPFKLGLDGMKYQNGLNDSELRAYRTPGITL